MPPVPSRRRCRPGPPRCTFDANSIAPALGREVAEVIAAAGAPFASATVHGAGPDLARAGQIFLSGSGAARAAGVVGDSLRVGSWATTRAAPRS